MCIRLQIFSIKASKKLKGIVQWIFLLAYVVVLISGYTLLFIGTKTDQYFLRYLQKHARILPVLKKQFIQEITVTWKATCRKHHLSPSDITIRWSKTIYSPKSPYKPLSWKVNNSPQYLALRFTDYIMRVSMDKNEENEEIETSLMEIKIFISRSSIEGGK